MTDILTASLIALSGAIISLLTGIPLFMLIEPATTISIWQILESLSTVIAPLIGALITSVIWLHRRITSLEEARQRQNASLYGIQGDTLAKGVTDEIRQLRAELQEFNASMEERLTTVEDRVENIENEMDSDD